MYECFSRVKPEILDLKKPELKLKKPEFKESKIKKLEYIVVSENVGLLLVMFVHNLH